MQYWAKCCCLPDLLQAALILRKPCEPGTFVAQNKSLFESQGEKGGSIQASAGKCYGAQTSVIVMGDHTDKEGGASWSWSWAWASWSQPWTS